MTYHWKNFIRENNCYEVSTDTANIVTYPVKEIQFEPDLFKFIPPFISSFTYLTIPSFNDNVLKALVSSIKKDQELDAFRMLGCSLQMQFSERYNQFLGVSGSDFSNYYNDLSSLLDYLYEYLKSENRSAYKGILFKNKDSNQSVQNLFVVDQVYDAICSDFNLTVSNFQVRKLELLKKTNAYDREKDSDRIKWDLIEKLNKYLMISTSSENESLRFIGAFLHIFSVPYKSKPEQIEISTNINDLLGLVDYQYIRNNITRHRTFLT